MNEEKLFDYVSSLRQSVSPGVFSIGAILFSVGQRDQVRSALSRQGLSVIGIAGKHPDIVLRGIMECVVAGTPCVIDIQGHIHPKLATFFSDLSEQGATAHIAGESTPQAISANADGSMIILMLSIDAFVTVPFQKTVTSTCTLK